MTLDDCYICKKILPPNKSISGLCIDCYDTVCKKINEENKKRKKTRGSISVLKA